MNEALDKLTALPGGRPPALVVFDLDDTLISGNSCTYWADFLKTKGCGVGPEWDRIAEEMLALYAAGTLDIHDYLRKSVRAYGHFTREERDRLVSEFIDTRLAGKVYPEALRVIARLRERGIPMMIVSASNAFVVRPVAKRLFDIDASIGVELEEDGEGRLTGEIVGTPSFQEGKIHCVEERLAGRGVDWNDVLFFTDSRNDIPLARAAAKTVCINPDETLGRLAAEKGWPVLAWRAE